VEGLARALDPEFDIWEASRPVIESWMIGQLGPEARLRDAAGSLSSLGRLVEHIPQLLRDTETLGSHLAQGGLKLHPDSVRAIAAAQLRRTAHVRVAIWIAAAGTVGILVTLL
jgi:ubiquinone biosynthesis protein